MTIAVLSDKATPIIQAIKKSRDSIDLVGGSNLVEFLTETRERNEFFERILIIDTAVTSGQELNDFLFLKEYVESYSPSMEIVLGIPRDRGSHMADIFLGEFSAPMYTVAYLPRQSSIQILKDLVTLPVIELKAKYFSLDNEEVKASEKKPEKTSTKKGGFFSKFFGKNNEESKKEESKEELQQSTPEVSEPVVSPTPSPVIGPPPVTPVVPVVPVAPSEADLEVKQDLQNNINALFNGITQETTGSLDEGSDLNFGDYGEMHLQTGFIAEEDDYNEPISSAKDSSRADGWGSVDVLPANDFSPIPNKPSNSDFSPISSGDLNGDLNTENQTTSKGNNFVGSSNENSRKYLGLGVTLVVGSSSSKFLSDTLNGLTGVVVVDTKTSVGMASYINEKAYLENTEEDYVERGNTYLLGVSARDLDSIISKYEGKDIYVNVSVSDLDMLVSYLSCEYSTLVVFDEDFSAFGNQILEFESVLPKTARVVSKGSAKALGGLTNKKVELLDHGVFSRINWKGLVK